MHRLRPFCRGSSLLKFDGHCANRLCFRSVARLLAFHPNSRRFLTHRHLSSAVPASESMFSISAVDPTNFFSRDQDAICGGGLWMDRSAAHLVLERDPEFKQTVFSSEEFEKYVNLQKNWNVVQPTREDFHHASPADLLEFLRFHTTSMGREDFREACSHISHCIPNLTNDELLEMAKVLYLVPYQGGNVPLIWKVLDGEFLARYKKSLQYVNENNFDYFLRVLDVVYWLNFISKSTFAECVLLDTINRSIRCKSNLKVIQILFYLSCGSFKWRNTIDSRHLSNYLNHIKHTCQFDAFLVAAECISLLQFPKGYGASKNSLLPHDLQYFLLSKANEHVNNDNALAVICQLLYWSSPGSVRTKPLLDLMEKIVKRNHLPFHIFFYISQTAIKCGIRHEKFLDTIENYLVMEKIHPKTAIRIFLNTYGQFGRKSVSTLGKKIDQLLKKHNICSVPEGHLLKTFAVLMDCGIHAYHLWELTMLGDCLVPNYTSGCRTDANLNSLHLTADDCISVFNPDYKGTRLSDVMRQNIHLVASKQDVEYASKSSQYHQFLIFAQKVARGHGLVTNILPGLRSAGMHDVIVCVDTEQYSFHRCNTGSVKPWNVKNLPAQTKGNLSFFALWTCRANWPPYLIQLKHSALQKLGYKSLLVDASLLVQPEELRDAWIHAKLRQ